jgi:hypothetical protein
MKYRAMRLTPYVTIFNTLQLLRLAEFSWWYVVALLGGVLIYLYEKHYGIQGELDVAWAESKAWQDFKKHFDKRMDEITAD